MIRYYQYTSSRITTVSKQDCLAMFNTLQDNRLRHIMMSLTEEEISSIYAFIPCILQVRLNYAQKVQSLQSALIGVSLKGISAREDPQIISPVSSSLEAAILATEV